MVIIENSDYLSTQNAVIDTDEYKETRQNIEYIKNDVAKYINIAYVKNTTPTTLRAFSYTKTKQKATHQWISLLHNYSINSISDR